MSKDLNDAAAAGLLIALGVDVAPKNLHRKAMAGSWELEGRTPRATQAWGRW